MTTYTDIVTDGWIARLPAAVRPYALLARADRPVGAWLLFLPGLWSILLARAPATQTAWLVALFLVGALLMRSAGCVVNDMWDRDLDRMVTRTAARPLASGVLRLRHAVALLVVLLSVSLMILVQLNPLAQQLGVISLALVLFYPLAKRVTWWPQLFLGFTFGWGAPMGFAAATGRLDFAAWALYGASIVWILGYDTIYAHQDREDDAMIGVRSTARLFESNSKPFIAVCYAVTIGLLGLAGWFAGLGIWFWPALAAGAVLLGMQVWKLDINDPAACLRLFKLNREAGLVVAGAILLGRL